MWLITQVVIVLLSFSVSLARKCVSLNNEPCMIRLTVIDLNSVDHDYFLLRVSLDKYSGSCNAADGLPTKICVPSKTKDINIKVFNVMTRRYETKTLIKQISSDCKCKFNTATCNSNQN